MLSLALDGLLPLRLAQNGEGALFSLPGQFLALLFQLPPRSTRFEPYEARPKGVK